MRYITNKNEETGINTVLTIMPSISLLFHYWFNGIKFFTLGYIKVMARRQY